MYVGQIGRVSGRKAMLIAEQPDCLRVLYLEKSNLGRFMNPRQTFNPFEVNVPKSAFVLDCHRLSSKVGEIFGNACCEQSERLYS